MERIADTNNAQSNAIKGRIAEITQGHIKNEIVEQGLFPGQSPINTVEAMLMADDACRQEQVIYERGKK